MNLSIYLAKLGVGVGDVVALGSEIRIEFIPTALAVVFTGATYTPFDLKIGRGKSLFNIINYLFKKKNTVL